jgi:hypothetical protein
VRTLLVGALAAVLSGCACPAPPPAVSNPCGASGLLCPGTTAADRESERAPAVLKAEPVTRAVKDPIASRTKAPAQPAGASEPASRFTTGVRPEHAPAARPADKADPVVEKAKATIAAKMENPLSLEFGMMKRAIRQNMRDEPIDTICGSVRGKDASGQATGEMLFLYLVTENEAYVADGRGDLTAEMAYRNICEQDEP